MTEEEYQEWLGNRPKLRFRWCYRLKQWRRGRYQRLANCYDCRKLFIAGTHGHICTDCGAQMHAIRGPLTQRALSLVAKEIRLGNLPRPSTLQCVDCGEQAQQYEHRDYTKPLDVEPVCRSCNARRGPGAPFIGMRRRGARLAALEARP